MFAFRHDIKSWRSVSFGIIILQFRSWLIDTYMDTQLKLAGYIRAEYISDALISHVIYRRGNERRVSPRREHIEIF